MEQVALPIKSYVPTDNALKGCESDKMNVSITYRQKRKTVILSILKCSEVTKCYKQWVNG